MEAPPSAAPRGGSGPAPMAGGHNLPALLAERLNMYERAHANAMAGGENAKARR